MMTVWLATIAGVVLVVLELRGWPYTIQFLMRNPHPLLGAAALLLAFLQPLLAACRPPPTSSTRWLFNWSHWFVGNCAHVIG